MMTNGKIRTYSEMIRLPTFDQRFEYLRLDGEVGKATFGYDRYLNQVLYNSPEWKKIRQKVIIRDNGCDLACEGYEICGRTLIHHINPITVEDIIKRNHMVFDLDNIVLTTHNTHNAIHYGDKNLLTTGPIERSAHDTCPWKR